MPSFAAFAVAAPELAGRVRVLLDAHVHKTVATLRADGSPRISGTEVSWVGEDLLVGSMPHARKVEDLRRDGRFALHSGSDDPPAWRADCKLSGVAVEVTDPAAVASIDAEAEPPGEAAWFRLDVREASVVAVVERDGGSALRVDVWTPELGLRELWPAT